MLLDRLLTNPHADPKAVFASLDARLDATLRAGGHVLVAEMLNPDDWDAPWMALLARGVTKARAV